MKHFITLAFGALVFFVACKSGHVNNAKSEQKDGAGIEKLNGSWELEYISGPRIAFQGLYSEKKPEMTFNASDSSFGGNTSCNVFNGKLVADSRNISFSGDMALTKMFCHGEGEQVFLETLKKINVYTVHDNILTFMLDEVPMMRFAKKQ